jgi:LAO/AO transport system kinase
VVLVETVGVGQSEVMVANMVDFFLVLTLAGGGDELQGIKRGIMEVADLIVVNKSDGDALKMARRAAADYRHALRMLPPSTPGWKTPVLNASATEGTGIAEAWDAIESHRTHLEQSGELERRRGAQQLRWLRQQVEEAVLATFRDRPGVAEAMTAAQEQIRSASATVPQAAAKVLEAGFGAEAPAIQ